MKVAGNRAVAPVGRVGLSKSLFDMMCRGGAVSDNKLPVSARKGGGNGPAMVGVDTGGYQVVNVADLSPAAANARVMTQAEAYALHDQLIRDDPSRAGAIQVMADHELYLEDAA